MDGSKCCTDDDSQSLRSNLTRCSMVLQKIRDVYCTPVQIGKILDSIETTIQQCAKYSEMNDNNHSMYAVVLKLLDSTTCHDTTLRLYFKNSPIWEHFHRNFREIVQVLRTCYENKPLTFNRKFVTMEQITRARCWGGGMKNRTLSNPALYNGVKVALPVHISPNSTSLNRSQSGTN